MNSGYTIVAEIFKLWRIQRLQWPNITERRRCSRIKTSKSFAETCVQPYRLGILARESHISNKFVQSSDNGDIVYRTTHTSENTLSIREPVVAHSIHKAPIITQFPLMADIEDQVSPTNPFIRISTITIAVRILAVKEKKRQGIFVIDQPFHLCKCIIYNSLRPTKTIQHTCRQ